MTVSARRPDPERDAAGLAGDHKQRCARRRPPTLVGQGGLNSQLRQLEGTSGGSGGSGGNADQTAQTSGFSDRNSGRGTSVGGPTGLATLGRGPDNLRERVVDALSNTNTVVQADAAGSAGAAGVSRRQQAQSQPQTQVIVTRGRFFADNPYTGFNNQTLAVTPDPQKNMLLTPTGTVIGGEATISLSDGRSLKVPWKPGAGPFAVTLSHPTFGPLNGTGLVSLKNDFFAFVFNTTSNQTIGVVGGTPTTMANFPTAASRPMTFWPPAMAAIYPSPTIPWAAMPQ